VTLNRAVAIANVDGAAAGLELIESIDASSLGHRVDAVRAHLLERLGEFQEAKALYLQAASTTDNTAEQRYLEERAARLPSS